VRPMTRAFFSHSVRMSAAAMNFRFTAAIAADGEKMIGPMLPESVPQPLWFGTRRRTEKISQLRRREVFKICRIDVGRNRNGEDEKDCGPTCWSHFVPLFLVRAVGLTRCTVPCSVRTQSLRAGYFGFEGVNSRS
jgi:hypothetical protein